MNLGFHTTTTDVTNENWTFPSPAFKWIFDSDDGLFGLCLLHQKKKTFVIRTFRGISNKNRLSKFLSPLGKSPKSPPKHVRSDPRRQKIEEKRKSSSPSKNVHFCWCQHFYFDTWIEQCHEVNGTEMNNTVKDDLNTFLVVLACQQLWAR